MNFRLAAMLSLSLAMAPLAFAQSVGIPSTPVARMTPAPSAPAKPGVAPAALVDVNSASPEALDALPGLGPTRVKAIIAGRPWTDKQDLVTRKAVPANVFAQIKDMIALVNVNTASAADMAKMLPNVGPVRAAAIVQNRPFSNVQDLVTKGVLTQGVFDGIKGMVTTK